MINIQDNIPLQIALNPHHHAFKRRVLRNTYHAYETAGIEKFTEKTIDSLKEFFLQNKDLESILDYYLSLGNYIKREDEGKFLYTLHLLTPTIVSISAGNIVDRSKQDCRKSIYKVLCTYFGIPLQQ